MAEPRRRRSVAQAQLVDLLTVQLAQHRSGAHGSEPASAELGTGPAEPESGRTPVEPTPVEPTPVEHALEVVDLGGGTGGLAQVLADLGHTVTVVDPSPDALASLERRTAEAGLVGRIRGVQGDAGDLVEVLGAASADVVVCHRTLEVVDVPADALASMARLLRPGGALSLLVAQRHAAVLGQALAGHVHQARRILADPAWFDYDQVVGLVEGAGFTELVAHGIGAVAGLVPGSLVETDPAIRTELRALEDDIAQDPAFRAVAPLLHVHARRR